MIQQISLPKDEVIQFITDELSIYRGELARLLLERLDFAAGHIFSFLPEDVNLDRIKNFTAGGLVHESDGRDQTAKFLLHKLTATNDTVMIFEEEMIAPEIWLSVEKEEDYYFFHKSSVYYFLLSHVGPDLLQVEKRMNAASFVRYPGFGILTLLPFSFHKGQQLELDKLEILATYTTLFMIEAYDGEAWIIWTRDKD